MNIELNDDQIELKKKLSYWYHHFGQGKPYFYYSGGAGTGKTTVIKSFIEDLGLSNDEYIACAYVGKAVLVLMRHGLPASTIHSLIYNPKFVTTKETEFDEFGIPYEKKKRSLEFKLKSSLPKSLKLIIVDEQAMVNDQMREDILSFGIPVVLTGDHNQLPPVFGNSSIQDHPDFILTKIMRQAEGNPIVYLSQCVLNDIPVRYGTYGSSRVLPSRYIDQSILTDYEMIICAKNNTREILNDRIREEILNCPDRKPILHDKVICRNNDWTEQIDGIFLTNGLTGIISDINYSSMYRDVIYIDFQPDFMEDNKFQKISIDYKYMRSDYKTQREYGITKHQKFEYAYAITAHLSQGSEYPRVLFMDEWFHDALTTKRLRYTAITRAVNSIDWVKRREEKRYYFSYDNF